ncbi:AMP-binding protein [Streptomyces sp. NPDC004296]|uniref:AMP-binding protein n=1 Tax=Streptomyces sp. NPDC004296 TaxID=3364697 RepID=UPI0036B7AA3B
MQRTIPELLEHARRSYPDRLAVAFDGERLTFAELHHRARSAAGHLADLGIEASDRIGVCLRPGLEQPITVLAASCVGAVVIPMHPNLMATNVAHVVRNAGIRLLVADDSRADELRTALPGVTIIPPLTGTDEDTARTEGRAQDTAETLVVARPQENDLAMLIYSSGSTGRPKGIMITHENLVRGAEIVAEYLGTRQSDRIAGLLTLNFDYGLNQLWQSLLTGASLHLHEFVMPRTAFRMLTEERITVLPVMPALVQRLFAARVGGVPEGLDLSSIRYVCSSGGAMSEWAINSLQTAFPKADLYLMYGLTEAFRSSYLEPAQLTVRPTSIGKAIPGVQLHVVDDEGNDCPPGEVGTLIHRGGCISKGYWNNPEQTARVFRHLDRFPGETVVWTGDLATADSEGYLYILGRGDSQLKRDGFRISPNEVEAVLNDHPAVAESVVLGFPDGDRGHRLVAAWVARPGHTADDGPDDAWLVANLPAHMIPGELRYMKEFPITVNNQGKADRIALKELLTAELSR